MDSRHTPYRSEVARWSPDDLANYFKKLSFKDCEKVVKKYNMTGQRFLNMSESDIQKFPKLRMPIVSKLSQEINRHEEKRSFFPKSYRTPTQKLPENTEYRQEGCDDDSSFDESDDYVSPDEDEDGVDYETPNDQDGFDDGNDADYEPPPSNDDNSHCNVIFPSNVIPATSEYIDRSTTDRSKTSLQPPVPPQRPGSSPIPAGGRGSMQSPFLSPTSYNESSREKNIQSFKLPPPSVDRSKKPPLDRSGPPFDRDILGPGKRTFLEMSLTPQLRHLGQELTKIQKPPVPSTERYERNNPSSRRKPQPIT